ncbi:MAG TPA: Ig-like domain-containing protein, partial [Gemmatimonadota bacterium]|nr:Ig-like domain-containing protein [Gemmatimonadota bacterium]
MSTRPGPKVVIELVIVSVVFIAALLFIYQGIAMVMYGSGPRNAAASTPGGAVQGETSPDSAVGLRFQLSEGAPRPDAEEAPPPRTRPLDESQVTRLLASLPPLPAEADVARAVALTDEIPPPPLTGTTVQGEFPPPEDVAPAEEPAAGPLEVLRFGPEGEVERARDLSITFNQPMVPVTSHQELAARNVPARLWPATQGRWRWVGTRTLLFEVDAGFPMATRYQVSVPAGVRSAVGTQLTGDVSWSFETPPPALADYYPLGRGPYERQPVIFLEFNQRIDPAAVLEHLQLRGPLRSRPEVRRASAAEIEADEAVKRRVQGAREGRWLAVRPSQPLPGGSNITVVVGEGTPSAEGPLTTRESQEFEFTTYGPLKVTEYDCGYGACTPGAPLRVEFSNPLDAESVDPSWVTVEPELANLRVSASHTSLMITGRTQPRTTYRVTLSAGIRDVFGQTLGEAARATMDIDSYPKALSARGGNLVVLDPDSPRQLIVKSVNHAQLDVRLYRVVPEDWSNFRERRRRRDEESYQPPGQLAHSARITVDAGQDEIAETRIDLGPALAVGLGQVIVVVEPTEQPEERWQRQEIITWVQATRIGLSAIQDADELIAWVTALDGAAPSAGAELSFLGDRRRQSTNAEGLATLTLPAGGGGRE